MARCVRSGNWGALVLGALLVVACIPGTVRAEAVPERRPVVARQQEPDPPKPPKPPKPRRHGGSPPSTVA